MEEEWGMVTYIIYVWMVTKCLRVYTCKKAGVARVNMHHQGGREREGVGGGEEMKESEDRRRGREEEEEGRGRERREVGASIKTIRTNKRNKIQ
jgi:hypothetical protein